MAEQKDAEKKATAGVLPESWRIQLPEFEGPLDLLLHLIRVNEVEITDIPVSTICDQFHEYLHLMEKLDLDIAAEYVYEAAYLIFLKSRMLLPRPKTVDGEPGEDPRTELVDRLIEYRKLKDAAQSLAEIHSVRRGIWTRPTQRVDLGPAEGETMDFGDVSLYDLLGALKTVLVRYDFEHPDPMLLKRETYSVRDQFERMLGSMTEGRPLDFLADMRERGSRGEVVAAFLAVLELARLGLIRMHRTDADDVLLYRTERELLKEELEAIQS